MDSVHSDTQRDPFGTHSQVEIIERGDGRAAARMTVTADHLNGLGMVHGGAIFTLADCVFAAACNSHGYPAVAINASISYVRAPKGRVLTAEAEELSREGKLGSYTVRILDEDGSVVATFHGLSYRKWQPPKERQ